jgi:protein-arginine kinase
MPNSKLSDQLSSWRNSEPDDVMMTKFIRMAKSLEREVEELKFKLNKSAEIIENMIKEAEEPEQL